MGHSDPSPLLLAGRQSGPVECGLGGAELSAGEDILAQGRAFAANFEGEIPKGQRSQTLRIVYVLETNPDTGYRYNLDRFEADRVPRSELLAWH